MAKEKKKRLMVEICPRLLKRWQNNKLLSINSMITKTEVNNVTNKLSIFCVGNHNCFCDNRVRKNPSITLVARGMEV